MTKAQKLEYAIKKIAESIMQGKVKNIYAAQGKINQLKKQLDAVKYKDVHYNTNLAR